MALHAYMHRFLFFFFLSSRIERFEEIALASVAFYLLLVYIAFCIEIDWVSHELAIVRPMITQNSGTRLCL
jgi:hypothetical protein